MLERMRESSRSGLTMVIFAIIIVVFAISFGAPMDGCQQSSGPRRAATVDGDDLMTDEIDIIYNRYGGQNKNATEDELAQEKAKALKALVIMHLLADQAEEMGLRVGDDELKRYLLSPLRNAEFQALYGRNGKFDPGYYKRYIEYQLRISQPQYEEFKKKELLAKKMLELAEMQVGVIPGEIDALQSLRETKVNLEYIKLAPATLKGQISMSDEELTAFIEKNQDKIKKAYEARKAEYTTPEQIRVRRIYILKPDETATPDQQKLVADTIADAKKRILEDKEDFGAVADDVATKLDQKFAQGKKGLMEWSAIGNMDQNIVKGLEGAKEGEIKEIDTEFSYMIVKLEGRKPEVVTPLEDVQKDIAKSIYEDSVVQELATSMAKEIEAELATTKDLAKALENLKKKEAATEQPADAPSEEGAEEPAAVATKWDSLSARETGPFSLEGQDLSALFGGQLPPGIDLSSMGGWSMIPGIGNSKEVALDAFKLTTENPVGSKIYTVEGAPVLIRLKERIDPPKADDNAEEAQKQQIELFSELRSKRLSTLTGGTQSIFLVPSGNYGPWIDNLYNQAIKSNKVTFNDRVKVAEILRNESTQAATTTPVTTPKEDTK